MDLLFQCFYDEYFGSPKLISFVSNRDNGAGTETVVSILVSSNSSETITCDDPNVSIASTEEPTFSTYPVVPVSDETTTSTGGSTETRTPEEASVPSTSTVTPYKEPSSAPE
ncbi:hypothetical protein L6452_01901 [Arctium lappa]|uniref:Uncharacterized protein n=1 Tax=Arctium lappa TaxID=4217 RepID=A0ACB9FIL2_ARCLA|nr:hypothetical protein L6452_01901 [Arctium lappa]